MENNSDVPSSRESILSLTKLYPSVSITPNEDTEVLVAVTDKYIICNWRGNGTDPTDPSYITIKENPTKKILT